VENKNGHMGTAVIRSAVTSRLIHAVEEHFESDFTVSEDSDSHLYTPPMVSFSPGDIESLSIRRRVLIWLCKHAHLFRT